METLEYQEPLTDTLKKPSSCEYCRGTNLKTIIYGFPSRAQMAKVSQGEAVLGNSEIKENMPHWHCSDCDHQFSLEMDPDFKRLQELEENRFTKKHKNHSSKGCECSNNNKNGSCCAGHS
jgi:hypothetical protein